ncbi:MAG: hypothetical protein GEU94_04660 [Micromonosporaceae bacterium]|nr:hypothetical protein [Micromonosporaceae bacterium]
MLQPEIIATLRANAEATLRRHQPRPDGRCRYCAITWQHADTTYPCPPARIARRFLILTEL